MADNEVMLEECYEMAVDERMPEECYEMADNEVMPERCRKMAVDQMRFEEAKRRIIGIDRNRQGIGTLSEKTVHAVLKNYYAPDTDMHEIPIENYVADIFTGSEIIEIQTRSFNAMRKKLDCFLALYPVTIVHPIPNTKWVSWIDEETGETSAKRKSPKHGNCYQVFPELYKIKSYLKDPNLHFRFDLIDMEEYRLLNGWSKDRKKGSQRYDRIPTEFVEEVAIDCRNDYMQFIPYDIEEPFDTSQFAKAAHIPLKLSQTTLNILYDLDIVSRVGKKGNRYLYEIHEIL